jgi:hypothetical protein
MRCALLLASCCSGAVAWGCSPSAQPKETPLDARASGADGDVATSLDAGDATLSDGEDALSQGVDAGDACESATCVLPFGQSVLASGQHDPAGVAVDATSVYWVNLGTFDPDAGTYSGGQIMKCSKTGCANAPTVLATGSWNGMAKLAVDDAAVYWFATGQVLKCPLSGCSGDPTVVWSGDGGVLADIALAGGHVYFTDLTNSAIVGCPVDGCGDAGSNIVWGGPTEAGFQPQPIAIASDGTRLYFTTAGGVASVCEAIDCAATVGVLGVLPSGSLLGQIAVDSTNFYVTNAIASGGGEVFSGSEDGGSTLTVLVDGLNVPTGIATDGTYAYFTEKGSAEAGVIGGGRVARCAVTGCNEVATAIEGYVTHPNGIAVDDTNVYWTDFGSSRDPMHTSDGHVVVRAK